MSDLKSFSAAGIHHLIIEQMASDASMEGVPDSDVFKAAYQSDTGEDEQVFHVEGDVARISGVRVTHLAAPADTVITVKTARGDLRVQKLAADVNLEVIEGSLRLLDLSGAVRVAQVSADLRSQGVADLRLMGSCGGDLRFHDGEHLAAESIAGDVRVQNLGEARLGRVRGDLWVDRMRGALQVSRVEGDVRLAQVAGAVSLRAVAGDLRASALTGGLSAIQVSGDAILQAPYGASERYSLTAQGDIVLVLPSDADARVGLRAAGRIRSDAPLVHSSDGTAAYIATLGRGTAQFNLTAGGDLRIVQGDGATQGKARTSTPHDLGDLGERIRRQVNASLVAAGISVRGETGWSSGRERPRPPREPRTSRTPGPEQSRSPGVSAEEQMAVLKMVGEGKITPEEADLLLRTLGG
jgi:hypothetical protein